MKQRLSDPIKLFSLLFPSFFLFKNTFSQTMLFRIKKILVKNETKQFTPIGLLPVIGTFFYSKIKPFNSFSFYSKKNTVY